MTASSETISLVAALYIGIGCIGFICNAATVFMIIMKRVFRLSAYTIMANVALADAIMMVVAGIACGMGIVYSEKSFCSPKNDFNETVDRGEAEMNTTHRFLSLSYETPNRCTILSFCLAFFEIAAWTAGVVSYAYLGLNRCVAICFYGTKAKTFNQVTVAIITSISTWIIGIGAACVGTFPAPLIGNRPEMWSVSFLSTEGKRPALFVIILLLINVISVVMQWVCSSLVLLKIRQVKQKISKNKLNQNSANRFRKQARLTFQFFYPSLLCTVSSILYFAKPYIKDMLSDGHFIALHLIWLCNHSCNPFIYAYFNERMRLTYKEMLTCAYLRYKIRMHRKKTTFTHGGSRFTLSRRSNNGRGNRTSVRSVKSQRNGNFVRNSLQMQSRDFEQLCEFMMRVNPLYDSSEGWRESSTDDESEWENRPLETKSEALDTHRESRSIVMDLGRQTVEHWARFAKKASI
uniref:G-protein coupled receptors family 1 profile domain-containing protein n=1 Tax=Panagrolaimus sp. JU765 TaxID=591449 RepID=A0AC34Q581_9BILA